MTVHVASELTTGRRQSPLRGRQRLVEQMLLDFWKKKTILLPHQYSAALANASKLNCYPTQTLASVDAVVSGIK